MHVFPMIRTRRTSPQTRVALDRELRFDTTTIQIVALIVPLTAALVMTYAVVAVAILVQGMTLPLLLRRLGLAD
jgi:hypothetical protein